MTLCFLERRQVQQQRIAPRREGFPVDMAALPLIARSFED